MTLVKPWQYEALAKHLIELVQWEVIYNFALVQQLSAAVTIAMNVTNSTFPYVTVPAYEITGGYADGMGGIMLAALAPLVKAEEKERWEAYSVEHQGWLQESEYLKIAHPHHRDALHSTIQDHEHDRRLAAPEPSVIPDKIWHREDGVPKEYTPSPGELMLENGKYDRLRA